MMRDKIGRQLENHRAWLDKNGERIEQRELRYLDGYLKDGSPQACQLITNSLDGLATVHGIRGIVEIVDATGNGWSGISRAIDCWGWSLKIRAEGFFGVPAFTGVNLTNQLSRAACLVCCSEAWSATAGAVLRRVVLESHAVDPLYWARRRFEPFVLTCLDLLDGTETSGIARPESPYGDVIESLNDEYRLRDALKVVCDYHVENIDDAGGDWDPEFKYTPFDLLPCEVMLVKELRSRSGRPPFDDIHHPLIQTLGKSTKLAASATSDRLLGQVEAVFVRCYQ